MHRKTYVCFECRAANRARCGPVICGKCRQSMRELHYKIEVPPKRDTKGWKRLRGVIENPKPLDQYYLVKSRHDRC